MDMRARGSARATAESNKRRRIDDDGRVCEYMSGCPVLRTAMFSCFLVSGEYLTGCLTVGTAEVVAS